MYRMTRLIHLAVLLAMVSAFVWTPATAASSTPVAANDAEFLATLAGSQGNIPSMEILPPSLTTRTPCTSHDQCPSGQLCCYPCGIEGCTHVCTTPVKGRCPLYS